MILLYSLLLVIKYDPSFVDKYTKNTAELMESIISIFFIVELLFRVIASGLFMTKNSYLKDAFNVFDFFLIMMIMISMVFQFIFIQMKSQGMNTENLEKILLIVDTLAILRPLRYCQRR